MSTPLQTPFRFLPLLALGICAAAAAENAKIAPGFREIAQPFIAKNCLDCHGEKKAKAGFRKIGRAHV